MLAREPMMDEQRRKGEIGAQRWQAGGTAAIGFALIICGLANEQVLTVLAGLAIYAAGFVWLSVLVV
jgi:hypothetical protein